MKKALAILMILALVASATFAEISVGAWGRGIFVPYWDDASGDAKTTNSTSWGSDNLAGQGWGGSAPRIGFTMSGTSDNVGVQADFNVDGGAMGLGDNQYIWVKPMSMVKVSLGNFYDDTLRGNEAFGSFAWFRPSTLYPIGGTIGESITFSRINEARGKQQFAVTLTPVENLYAVVSFTDVGQGANSPALQENMFKNMQAAFGYTIDGIGQIKAQYITVAKANLSGGFDSDPTVEIAFKFTAVENLVAEAGIAIKTNDDYAQMLGTAVEGYKKIALTANYKMDAITLHFYNVNQMAKVVAADETYTIFDIGVGADYALDGGITVEGDIRYNDLFGKDASDFYDATTLVFAGVSKGFSNGKIGVGLQYGSGAETTMALPIKVEYWF